MEYKLQIKKIKLNKNKRIICISDIHGGLPGHPRKPRQAATAGSTSDGAADADRHAQRRGSGPPVERYRLGEGAHSRPA